MCPPDGDEPGNEALFRARRERDHWCREYSRVDGLNDEARLYIDKIHRVLREAGWLQETGLKGLKDFLDVRT